MIRKLMAAVALTAVLLMSGCATSRSEVKLRSPTIAAPAATSSAQRVVVIGKITDERVFEEAPDDPSTPSLGFGGAGKASADVKARAIGRKRNSYGKALGDVVLQSGQTVQDVVRENLVAAFQQAGYQVKDAGDAGPSPIVVDVHIKKFWEWVDPGFWAITLNTNIATDLVISGTGAPVVVDTHVDEKRAVATESDWIQIVEKGLDAYRADVAQRMPASAGAGNAAQAAVMPVPLPMPAPVPAVAAPAPVPAVQAGPAAAELAPESPAPAGVVPSSPPLSAATAPAANIALAQTAANQMGCGAVQPNGGSTFIAPCDGYKVLIDCDGGQCRPMHTVKASKDNQGND